MRSAVFVDKDGTLIDDVPYSVEPGRIALAAGARDGIAALARAGFRIIVVSNQPGAALGYFDEKALLLVGARLQRLLNGSLSGFYYCPHHPQSGCECRKPAPGLLLRAARDHEVDLGRSWMVGDILDDVEAGRRAGCRTCLVDNGNETEWLAGEMRRPDLVATNLGAAAAMILGAS